MEIIIKTKQTFNAHFSFLHYADRLFPYYKHLLKVMSRGEYLPVDEAKMENGGGDSAVRTEDSKTVEEEEEEEEEDEDYELHPLLRGSGSSVVTISSPLVSAGLGRSRTSGSVNAAPPVHSNSSDVLPCEYSSVQSR